MFTGIIQEVGTLTQISDKSSKRYLTITCSSVLHELKIGDSVATNGICLTVTAFNQGSITVECMHETLIKTTAHLWRTGETLNLERALRLSDRIDGHLVLGHIDTVCFVQSVYSKGNTSYMEVSLPSEYAHHVVEQGSVALNGVSLTVAHLSHSTFTVALISLTKNDTNLAMLKAGAHLNIEFDVIGKYILRSLTKHVSIEDLIKKYDY